MVPKEKKRTKRVLFFVGRVREKCEGERPERPKRRR